MYHNLHDDISHGFQHTRAHTRRHTQRERETHTRRQGTIRKKQTRPFHVISIWRQYIDIKNYIWLLQSAISLFFVNLQLGFVFVVLNLFGEKKMRGVKKKKKKKTITDDDDYRRGATEVKLSVHVIFLFVLIWLSVNIGVIYTVTRWCRLKNPRLQQSSSPLWMYNCVLLWCANCWLSDIQTCRWAWPINVTQMLMLQS